MGLNIFEQIMKNTLSLIIFSLFVVLFTVSCSDENDVITNEEGMVLRKFKAVHGVTYIPGTRTALKDDGTTVVWQSKDSIGVISSSSTKPTSYLLDEGVGETAGTFTGYSPDESNSGFYGISPYNDYDYKTVTRDGNVIKNLVVPGHQKAIKGSYDPRAAVMTAYTTNNTMLFKHVCSFVKIVVGTEDEMKYLMRISIESINSDKSAGPNIAGTFDATIATSGTNQSQATVSNITNGSNKIILEPASGETIEPGTYYVALLPGTYQGLEVRFETVKKSLMRRLKVQKDYNRAEIRNLGKFPGNDWTWTEDKTQEVVYAGKYDDVGRKDFYFATGNLQAVMSGDPSNPIKKWRIAPEQYVYEGMASVSGNYKVSTGAAFADGDIVDLFAWTAKEDRNGNAFSTDKLKKYGINNQAVNSGTTFYYYDNANTSTLYSSTISEVKDAVCDWAGAYKESSGSKRNWHVLSQKDWYWIIQGRSGAHAATKCTVTLEDGTTTVTGMWVYPNGSSLWASIATTINYEKYLENTAKGCMFLPYCGYTYADKTSLMVTTSGYYWCCDAEFRSGQSDSQQRWFPFRTVGGNSGLSYNSTSANYRHFVRLVSYDEVK